VLTGRNKSIVVEGKNNERNKRSVGFSKGTGEDSVGVGTHRMAAEIGGKTAKTANGRRKCQMDTLRRGIVPQV
jgi:hypothetical protein